MLRHFYYPLLAYRDIVYPFLLLSAIAVPPWLAFRLYRHRTRRYPLSFRREFLLLTFVVYLAGVVAATLTPNGSTRLRAEGRGGIDLRPNLTSLTCSTGRLRPGSTARSFCLRNARGNAILFFPLGLLLPLVFRRLRFWRAMQLAIAASLGIELVQLLSSAWGSYRAADINDVILNSAGACVGLLVVFLLRLCHRRRDAVSYAQPVT